MASGSRARIAVAPLWARLCRRRRARSDARPRRALWWTMHSWVGLNLSLFLAFVLGTGTLAVIGSEIDWLANPAMRAAPTAARAAWGTFADAAQKAVPGGRVVSLHAPPHAWFAPIALVETAEGESLRLFLDPASGAVQGATGWGGAQQLFRQLHRRLMLPAAYGVPIVSSAAVLLLIALVTGLASYKRFWRGFLQRPRGGGRRLAGDLHRLAGLWSLWFLAVIALTGSWYFIESLGGGPVVAKLARTPTTPIAMARKVDGPAIDRLAAVAQAAYPALAIRAVRLPEMRGEPIAFMGQADALLVGDRANAVWLDPSTDEVLQVDRGEAMSAHRRIAELADPLHFGTWAGMASKLAWFLFGLLLTSLPVTGAIVYSLRLDTARREAEAGAASCGAAGRWVRGMGAWAYVAGALIANSLVLAPLALLG
jgi:uncharacterized iron-regulated membrane protein